MKKLFNIITSLGMCLTLAFPIGAFAQGELSQCQPLGQEREFPCALQRTVIRSETDLKAITLLMTGQATTLPEAQAMVAADQGGAVSARLQSCQPLGAQKTYPCEMNNVEVEDFLAHRAEILINDRVARTRAEAYVKIEDYDNRQAQNNLPSCKALGVQGSYPCGLNGVPVESFLDHRAEILINDGVAKNRPEAYQKIARYDADKAAEQQAQAERAARRARDQQSAAAANTNATRSHTVTEQVTTDEVRSSTQEFDTKVSANARDSGLSKFEKALLLGLGAVAVGSILKNGDKVVSRSGDRVVVENPSGDLRVLKDDDALIRRPGDAVETQTFNDGSSRTIISKPDGTQVVTVRGRDGSVLRRTNVDAQGREYVLFDDTVAEQHVVVADLPQVRQPALQLGNQNDNALRAALAAQSRSDQGQRFSLRQVREIRQVRALAPELELDAVRFQSGSAAIRPEQAHALANIGRTLSDLIAHDPSTVILVEGHTDAVGDARYNLALSDRRAETVALALTEYFLVPPENLITQGYGEASLKVPTLASEPANRRAVVRNITGLLR